MDLLSLLDGKYKTRVSSVLNKDVKEYGKQFMFDGREDTCWNSDQGSPQIVLFQFETPLVIEKVNIQFQGGFAGKDCKLELVSMEDGEKCDFDIYPEDVNQKQTFELAKQIATKSLKIIFLNSTDFFGRIIIYQLQFYGKLQSE